MRWWLGGVAMAVGALACAFEAGRSTHFSPSPKAERAARSSSSAFDQPFIVPVFETGSAVDGGIDPVAVEVGPTWIAVRGVPIVILTDGTVPSDALRPHEGGPVIGELHHAVTERLHEAEQSTVLLAVDTVVSYGVLYQVAATLDAAGAPTLLLTGRDREGRVVGVAVEVAHHPSRVLGTTAAEAHPMDESMVGSLVINPVAEIGWHAARRSTSEPATLHPFLIHVREIHDDVTQAHADIVIDPGALSDLKMMDAEQVRALAVSLESWHSTGLLADVLDAARACSVPSSSACADLRAPILLMAPP